MEKADIGLIGLAVMGQNLALNINDHGFRLSVYNRTTSKVDEFINGAAKGTQITGTYSIEEFVNSLSSPRRILLMVKAGEVVDHFLDMLIPHLEMGDIIMDGGNSLYTDTTRRVKTMEEQGIIYLGTGISGGEEGARNGPSIMPGGNKSGWSQVKPILQSITAQVDGEPCCEWIGEEGAGHYVKMVHNGIEYGDMQLICEAYQFLREGLSLSVDEIADIFTQWNEGELNSYLIEITSHILRVKDTDGEPLVDKILDTAGQKGTGKWTAINSLELGIPLTLIGEAVFARFLSALKSERVKAAKVLAGPDIKFDYTGQEKADYINAVKEALYASKIISYTQGYMLMREAAKAYQWNLNYGGIALMWRGGCIIRSRFLDSIKSAYSHNPELESLLLDDFFQQAIASAQTGWRKTVSRAVESGIPVPGFAAALTFYDGYRMASVPANLLQAQRDYFGAHTFERTDKPRGEFFHYEWADES
ncbi:MAG: decarboxylating NADP(+)-dependent phosphogluconate dehydrogenase [gamma proteobacterium symbiont of Bathyaustriella thionipta]|nr:decarboxylating NADP(+)-dependent phosphogluconate dehydrogenase [gamma proteobacterium symbiont of Bathyaustriella thionipta]MCU7948631.1 decarboxylating NADP(+)-dependent phosphogluconate dehydrogenase [gamma proteobacterium symbiont of Bathyaustriella thionipta]MCU7953037.1 decarboxylating NADP(+)-dependent phosphogluconate dehydrogenase [gamma proteobacterium symbiont of Bathyaustriella thionipta]MCU7955363.1 decarboxylating NADP(+)-dependent phosphogluconate dehydrogenase [gamma proteoba